MKRKFLVQHMLIQIHTAILIRYYKQHFYKQRQGEIGKKISKC